MLGKKRCIGEEFPWMYKLKGTCYYSWMCPTEMNHIERKWSLVMWLFFRKKNDRYA